jgi:predicted nucleotidyltransferase
MTELIDIVSSRVRAEVFRLLFDNEHRELHLREIARQSGLAIGTIQQEVKQLLGSGLILSRRDGNRLYFRANGTNPLFIEIRSLVAKTMGLIPELKNALVSEDIRCAFVFGSVARHEAKPQSDVDLMIVGRIGLRKLSGILERPSKIVGREINPHVLSVDEFSRLAKSKDHFVATVLRDKRLFVIGDEDELARLVG